MRILKFTFLASVFCLNLFSFDFSKISYWEYAGAANYHFFPNPEISSYRKGNFSQVDAKFIGGNFLRIGDDIYSHNGISETVFNSEFADDTGFFLEKNNVSSKLLFFYDPSSEKHPYPCFFLSDSNKYNGCSSTYSLSTPGVKNVNFTYYSFTTVTKIATCQPGENFNTSTKQCQKCEINESWDDEGQKCYKDCSKGGGINKIPQTDGSCIDCSGEKDSLSVLQCICRGYGNSSIDPKIWGKNGGSPDGCQLEGTCGDGSTQYSFTNPKCKSDPKPDDNKTKPDDPKPDDNKTKPDDPGSGNNNGGDKDKNKDKDKDKDFCKKNPNDPKCKKNDSNATIPTPGDDKAKFNPSDFDIKELGKEMSSFQKAYKGAISQIEKNFSGSEGFNSFKDGIDQFINNLKGQGLNDISKKDIPKTCSHKETIDFFGYNVVIDFDFCKIIEPASGAFYYLFYVFFFGCFLFLIIKFLIFSF
jgi:hypothetical protein